MGFPPSTNRMDYFLKPLSSTARIVCTQKANGEAAHMSVRRMGDRFVLCAGSKNVHLLVRQRSDVEKYRDSRFLVAKTVAESCLRTVEAMDGDDAAVLLSFLARTRCTCVFEVLQPHYQHVVDLSYLEVAQKSFIYTRKHD